MLELIQISKSFGSKTVADHISLNVANGQLLAVLGPSGCGKSTLLNITAGLIKPDSGQVKLNSNDLTPLPPEQRRTALMFQDYALLPHLNVWQNVAFGLKMQGIATKQARQQALAALAEMGLAAESERKTGALSGGEQQRVALARALITNPRLLLLDEPFSSLDTGLRRHLREQTLQQIRRQHIPAILVTHDPEEAFQLADHLALMHSGRLVQHGTPADLLARPANAWAASLLGCPNTTPQRYIPQSAISPGGANPQPATILALHHQPESCRLRLQHPQHGELELLLSWAQADTLKHDLHIGGQLPISINEEHIVHFAAG